MLNTEEENSGSIRDELIAAFRSGPEDKTSDTQSAEREGSQDAAPHEPDKELEERPSAAEQRDKSPEAAAKEGKAEQPKAFEPPARWTKEEKEDFLKLDPKIQDILLKRNKGLEAAFTRRMTELAQERQRYSNIEPILAARREQFARSGLDDARALNMVFTYWDQAQRDPIGFIDQFARERGLDLTSIYGPTTEQLMEYIGQGGDPSQSPGGSPAMHPLVQRQFQELHQQNQMLQQQLAQVGQSVQGWQQQQQQSVQQAARSEYDAFRNATDESGEPRYPYFEELRSDMAHLMRTGYASNLSEAYDKAQRVRPDIWAKVTEHQELVRRRDEERRRSEEAAKAKRAGSSVSGGGSSLSPPAGGDGEEDLSLRALISKQFAAARAGTRL